MTPPPTRQQHAHTPLKSPPASQLHPSYQLLRRKAIGDESYLLKASGRKKKLPQEMKVARTSLWTVAALHVARFRALVKACRRMRSSATTRLCLPGGTPVRPWTCSSTSINLVSGSCIVCEIMGLRVHTDGGAVVGQWGPHPSLSVSSRLSMQQPVLSQIASTTKPVPPPPSFH